jgi:hypothetical protein
VNWEAKWCWGRKLVISPNWQTEFTKAKQ